MPCRLRNYRRTDEVVRQVIRHRFLDPEISPEVIAQKLGQTGYSISTRSVERTIADFGLQKKLYALNPNGLPIVAADQAIHKREKGLAVRRAFANVPRSVGTGRTGAPYEFGRRRFAGCKFAVDRKFFLLSGSTRR
jgi:hypothetical protein